jgi:filamentous hemagglutinin
VTYLDRATGQYVSTGWNNLSPDVQDAIRGGATVASILIPAGAAGRVGKAMPECCNAPNSPIVPGGGLQAHEAAGGHLISRHVGKSDVDLGARLNSQPNITAASSFPDRATAERAVSSALDANTASISQFLNGTGGRLVINHNVGSPVGNVMSRGATTSAPSSNVRVVIQRDATMPTGYRIVTGFPVP